MKRPLKKRILNITLSIFTLLDLLTSCAVHTQAKEVPPTQVCFSPHGGATQAIINEIAESESEILVQAYSFTSAPIVDKETVITGSFNFIKAAEVKNAENVLIIKSQEQANLYTDNWMKHEEHSEKYERK